MKSRSQLGAFLTACLAAALLCGTVSAQKKSVGQTEAPKKPPARPGERVRPQAPRPNLHNALPPQGNANNLPPKAIEKLQDLPPEKQEEFLENNQRFNSLTPEQQAKIHERLEAWNRLTPEQQQALRDRQRVWEQMTPQQRQYVQQSLFPRWQQMPQPRRQAILQRLHSLRNLTESDRQAKLSDPAFTEGLSSEDRDMLGQLAHLHVGMAPD